MKQGCFVFFFFFVRLDEFCEASWHFDAVGPAAGVRCGWEAAGPACEPDTG